MEQSLAVFPSLSPPPSSPPPARKMPYTFCILRIITRASRVNGLSVGGPGTSALTVASLSLNQLCRHPSATLCPLPSSSLLSAEPRFPEASSSSSSALAPCPSLLALLAPTPRMGHEDNSMVLCLPHLLNHSLVFLLPFLAHSGNIHSHLPTRRLSP